MLPIRPERLFHIRCTISFGDGNDLDVCVAALSREAGDFECDGDGIVRGVALAESGFESVVKWVWE